jgi:hypothetical protein
MDTTTVAPISLISTGGLATILLIVGLALSELLPYLPIKANSVIQLTILPVINKILSFLGKGPIGTTKGQ